MQVGKEFDKLESDYTAKIIRWVPYYQEMISSLSEGYPPDFAPLSILDLGAGNGNVSALLQNRFPDADKVIVDASAKMIATCKKRFSGFEQFSYVEKYFQDLHFLPASFDMVVAGLSIHHLQGAEKEVLFRNVHAWLKPGGVFSICDLFVNPEDEVEHQRVLGEWERLARMQGSTDEDWAYLMDHYDKYDHPNSYEQQLYWMKNAGFEQTSIPFIRDCFGTIRALRVL